MGTVEEITHFAARLEAAHLKYHMGIVRAGWVMFCIAVPGERWEVEFAAAGDVEIEVFRSDGTISDADGLDELFDKFSD